MAYCTYHPPDLQMNATTRRTPAPGSYRLRRNLLGYCLVRVVEASSRHLLRSRTRCSSIWGLRAPRAPQNITFLWTVDTRGLNCVFVDRRRPMYTGAIIGLVFCVGG